MKINKFLLSATTLSLGLSANLFAGTMGDIKDKWDVYVPNLAKSNEFTAGALFFTT
jgi:hypothetical protein